MRRKFSFTALALALALALVAPAAVSASTQTSSVAWNHVRGLDSVRSCGAHENPFMHWVLTPGGKAKVDVAGSILDVDGNTTAGVRQGKSASGAIHFYTNFYDPAEITSAVATVRGNAGSNALMTISDACGPDDDGGPALPCDASTLSGGDGVTTTLHGLGTAGPTSFLFQFDAYFQPDKFEVFYEGTQIYDSGWRGSGSGWLDPNGDPITLTGPGAGSATIDVPAGTSTNVTVVVTGQGPGTAWDYRVNCPNPS